MPLSRASAQKHKSLREFYQEVATDSHAEFAEAGRKMIELLERLEEALRDISAWGLTSHYQLKLLATDDYRTPWFVSIAPPASGTFVIEYLIPESEAPWLNARVVGEATTIASAVDMTVRAMEKSGGWNR